jgi:hypothetical protein
MGMDQDRMTEAKLPREQSPEAPRLATMNPRLLSNIPPPPMIVIHEGCISDRTTERPAAELAEEDRERQKHA